MDFVAYKPSLDWLTWYSEVWEDVNIMRAEYIRRLCSAGYKDKRVKVLKRFTGGQLEGVSWGENRQGGVLVGEGAESREIERFCRFTEWSSKAHATRIDLQVTVRQHPKYNTFALSKTISSPYGSEPYVRTDANGLGTVYIGSRSSEKMFRIYQKADREGELFTRFEIEVKGKLARLLWDTGLGEHAIHGYLANEFFKLKLKKYAVKVLSEIGDVLSGVPTVQLKLSKPVPHTLIWLEDSVTPAIIRLLNDHESSQYVRSIVQSWHEICKEKDGMNE